MNSIHHLPYPDHLRVPSELSFERGWDGEAISGLIRSKSGFGVAPAFLFLGRWEARLLADHLAEVFGYDAVESLHGTYYKGLKIITVACDNFLSVGGCKKVRNEADEDARRQVWRAMNDSSIWRFQI